MFLVQLAPHTTIAREMREREYSMKLNLYGGIFDPGGNRRTFGVDTEPGDTPMSLVKAYELGRGYLMACGFSDNLPGLDSEHMMDKCYGVSMARKDEEEGDGEYKLLLWGHTGLQKPWTTVWAEQIDQFFEEMGQIGIKLSYQTVPFYGTASQSKTPRDAAEKRGQSIMLANPVEMVFTKREKADPNSKYDNPGRWVGLYHNTGTAAIKHVDWDEFEANFVYGRSPQAAGPNANGVANASVVSPTNGSNGSNRAQSNGSNGKIDYGSGNGNGNPSPPQAYPEGVSEVNFPAMVKGSLLTGHKGVDAWRGDAGAFDVTTDGMESFSARMQKLDAAGVKDPKAYGWVVAILDRLTQTEDHGAILGYVLNRTVDRDAPISSKLGKHLLGALMPPIYKKSDGSVAFNPQSSVEAHAMMLMAQMQAVGDMEGADDIDEPIPF